MRYSTKRTALLTASDIKYLLKKGELYGSNGPIKLVSKPGRYYLKSSKAKMFKRK